MTPGQQKRDRLLLQIETANRRCRWAQATAKSNGSTPALKRFTQDSLKEWNELKAKLAKLNRQMKLERLSRELTI